MRPFRTDQIKHTLVVAVVTLMAATTLGAPVGAAEVGTSGSGAPVSVASVALTTTDIGARAGISVGSGVLWESDAQQAADLDAIAASGAKWFAFDLDWNHIQYEGPNAW